MNKPTPIYKDHTGQWREQNPNFKSGGRDKEIEETKAWHAFEQSITYHPFPDAPETKQGEVVMARLQWQELGWGGNWVNVEEINKDPNPYDARQIWVAVTDSAKEEEVKEVDWLPLNEIEESDNSDAVDKLINANKLPNSVFESPSAPKVESAERVRLTGANHLIYYQQHSNYKRLITVSNPYLKTKKRRWLNCEHYYSK